MCLIRLVIFLLDCLLDLIYLTKLRDTISIRQVNSNIIRDAAIICKPHKIILFFMFNLIKKDYKKQ